mmetsp:Transcript_24272/g.41775  ORF Transcript_24272/g.41775 Transcript_24272/m.41775 type:complete len:207 (-) Transcript_24272:667-1287(-)
MAVHRSLRLSKGFESTLYSPQVQSARSRTTESRTTMLVARVPNMTRSRKALSDECTSPPNKREAPQRRRRILWLGEMRESLAKMRSVRASRALLRASYIESIVTRSVLSPLPSSAIAATSRERVRRRWTHGLSITTFMPKSFSRTHETYSEVPPRTARLARRSLPWLRLRPRMTNVSRLLASLYSAILSMSCFEQASLYVCPIMMA